MGDDKRVSFSVDSVFDAIGGIFRLLGNLLHPLHRFINSVSDAGWIGFALVFMLFFMLYLARASLRSGRPVEYGEILAYIGYRGLLLCAGYFLLLLLEYLFMPPLVIVATCLHNTVSGGEPGIFQMIGLLFGDSPGRREFLSDVIAFYGTSHSVLPLGVRAFGLIAIAIFCLWVVGQALRNLRLRDQ